MSDEAPFLPLTEAHFEPIGYVTAYATLLETFLENAIWWILGVQEDRGRPVTQSLPFNRKFQMLSELAEAVMNDQEKAQFAPIKSALRDAGAKRNDIVHAFWHSHDPATGTAVAVQYTTADAPKGQLKARQQEYSPDEIRNIAEEIRRASGQLQTFLLSSRFRR